ncbi:MAG: hypothetical protein R2771_07215 [Saprospiraceae bacterium]
MLTKQAFNAFLKPLKNPPEHAIFILATTEKHKVIPTILSRCQIYDFQAMNITNIIDQLKIITDQEKITYEEEALLTIAKKADGAMRDALSLYDRVLSASEDNSLKYKNVLELLNLLDYDYYFKLTDFLLQNNLSEVYILFNKILKEGFDANFLVVGLAEHFRQVLLSKDVQTQFLLEVGEELLNRYVNQARLCTKEFLLSGLDILNKCDYQFNSVQNKRLHVEIALSKISYLNNLSDFHIEATEKKKLTTDKSETIQENTQIGHINDKIKQENNTQVPDSSQNNISKEDNSPENTTSYIKKPNQTTSNSDLKIPTLEQLKKEIEQEEKNKKEKIPADIQITFETIENFKTSINSQIVLNVLKEIEIETKDNNILIFVPSNLAKDILSQEQTLMKNIRNDHFNDELNIEIIVDLNKFPNHQEIKPKKLLSNREKYENVVEENPKVIDLIKTFDLLIDL